MRVNRRFFLLVGAGRFVRAGFCFNSNSVTVLESQKMEIKKVSDSLKRSDLLIRSFDGRERYGKGERKRNKTSFKRQGIKNGWG